MEQLKKQYPQLNHARLPIPPYPHIKFFASKKRDFASSPTWCNLKLSVMVRGGEVLNDATVEDAEYAGIDSVAEIISSGIGVSGTVYKMLSDEAKSALDNADIILSKGQGNYEALSGQGRHIFYSFLCKCERFTNRFGVPKLTGIFVEEK